MSELTPWTWHYTNISGEERLVEGTCHSQAFDSKADAEQWLGTSFEELLAAGVDNVTLHHRGQVEYGPMSLHPQ